MSEYQTLTQAEIDKRVDAILGQADDGEGAQEMKDWADALNEVGADRLIGLVRDNYNPHPNQTAVNLDKLRKAYEASWVRHPYEWQPSSGMIDEVDGRFLALAFNLMHLLVAGTPKPGQAPLSTPKAFHEGGRA